MALKEQEKGELIESYEAMRSEAQEMAITLQQLQGTLNSTKTEVLAISKVSVWLGAWARNDVCVVVAGEARGGSGDAAAGQGDQYPQSL